MLLAKKNYFCWVLFVIYRRQYVRPFFIFIIYMLFVAPSLAQVKLEGSVTKVRDGDTIEVGQIPIRLQGLTCDELGTRKGQDARNFLEQTIAGEQVICNLNGQSSYDRLIGRCRVVGKKDIGQHLIEKGHCGRCNRYDEEGTYKQAQTKAGFYKGKIPKYCH